MIIMEKSKDRLLCHKTGSTITMNLRFTAHTECPRQLLVPSLLQLTNVDPQKQFSSVGGM